MWILEGAGEDTAVADQMMDNNTQEEYHGAETSKLLKLLGSPQRRNKELTRSDEGGPQPGRTPRC